MPQQADTINQPHDPLRFFREADIQLSVKLPYQHEYKVMAFRVGQTVAEALTALPRDRELPWAVNERRKAQEMAETREMIAQAAAKYLAGKLMELFAAQDPINGYPPDMLHQTPAAKPQPHSS